MRGPAVTIDPVGQAYRAIYEFERRGPQFDAKVLRCSYESYYNAALVGLPYFAPNIGAKPPEAANTFLGLPLYKDRTVLVGFVADDKPPQETR